MSAGKGGYRPKDGYYTGNWCKAGKAGTCFLGLAELNGRPGAPVFRLDPEADRNSEPADNPSKYGPAERVSHLKRGKDKRKASKVEVARAAYVISKYAKPSGGSSLVNAAVDAALSHLLHGRAWKLHKKLGRKRLRKTGHASEIRSRAQAMLADALANAGPYHLKLTKRGTVATEGSAYVSANLTNGRGAPMVGIPIRFTHEGTTHLRYTNDNGTAAYWWSPTKAGNPKVTVRAGVYPDTLLVRNPKNSRHTRVALIERRQPVEETVTVPIQQRTTLGSDCVPNDYLTTQYTHCFLRYTGYDASPSRKVTTKLFGPFNLQSGAKCWERYRRNTWSFYIKKDGQYQLPKPMEQDGVRPGQPGWYVWAVGVASNANNTSAYRCGAYFRVVKSTG